MAEIIQLDELVPDDITFVYRSKEYYVPGDLDTETVFRVFKYLREVVDLRTEDGGPMDEASVQRSATRLEELLLSVFQIRDPDLRGPLPFGARSLPIITAKLLEAIGINLNDAIEADAAVPTVRASRSPKRSSSVSAKPRPQRK